jgi:hypothetical protein
VLLNDWDFVADLLVIWLIWQEVLAESVLTAKGATPNATARHGPGITVVNRFISPITL